MRTAAASDNRPRTPLPALTGRNRRDSKVPSMAMKFLSRMIATALVGTAAVATALTPALAADKVTFLTSWFAQAEHGGFYQAKASGLYEKAGLDVTIKMGGPQVNGSPLLLGGETDMMIGYDFQVLNGVSKGLPVITVGTDR